MEARLTEPAKCASDALGASVLTEIEAYRIFFRLLRVYVPAKSLNLHKPNLILGGKRCLSIRDWRCWVWVALGAPVGISEKSSAADSKDLTAIEDDMAGIVAESSRP